MLVAASAIEPEMMPVIEFTFKPRGNPIAENVRVAVVGPTADKGRVTSVPGALTWSLGESSWSVE